VISTNGRSFGRSGPPLRVGINVSQRWSRVVQKRAKAAHTGIQHTSARAHARTFHWQPNTLARRPARVAESSQLI
jgi:hypothetical protein